VHYNLPTAFIFVDAFGVEEYSKAFTNPGSTAADFYIRLRAYSFSVYDFRMNVMLTNVTIAPLTSVPKNSIVPLQVTVSPASNQRPITLSLRTLSGTGDARFADGSSQMVITQTTTVQIKGVTESSATDNIRLEAKDGSISLDTEDFFVSPEQCPWTSPDRTTAPDANVNGTHVVTNAEYRFPAAIDHDVLPWATTEDFAPNDPATGREVELWAHMWRPSNLSGGPYPLVVFLHGNHGTCGRGSNPRIDTDYPFNDNYTTTGRCPVIGETEIGLGQTYTSQFNYVVVPSHMGYKDLAEKLAKWGYIVVSINANRGITAAPDIPSAPPNDPYYIDARGRLVLRHLQQLSGWNTNGGAPPQLGDLRGKINFDQVGLMGHSRGGEGMRAAKDLYGAAPWSTRIPGMTIRGIFEFAPTDGGANRDLQAAGVAWNVVLPMCDGDVFELLGVKPFDRMMTLPDVPATPKSTFTVWGANHNFFNTEWQQNDRLVGCVGHTALPQQSKGSTSQQQIALASLVAFFRANVGPSANSTFNQNFDPRYALPPVVTSVTRVDQGYTTSPSSTVTKVFDDFNPPRGNDPTGVSNFVNHADVSVAYSTVPRHDPSLRAAWISWNSSGPERYFQSNWTAAGVGNDMSAYQTLDFRVFRRVDVNGNLLNPPDPTNFSIQLVMGDGSVSNGVSLCKYADLRGPVGGPGGRHPILQTVRIPLSDFTNADLSHVRGVRFVFNISATGYIHVANIRLSP
jgi:hypothetical protein